MYTQCKEESHAEHKAMTERFAIKIERKVEIELQRSKRSRNNLRILQSFSFAVFQSPGITQ